MEPSLSALSAASANIKVVWALLRESSFAWLQDNAPSMGAALTFYAILSLAPVLMVATAVAGLGFWQKTAEVEVFRHIKALAGETGANKDLRDPGLAIRPRRLVRGDEGRVPHAAAPRG